MGHHACHGGYNRTDLSGRFSSRGFALGSLKRRVQDWFDWMLPEAWSIEHNQLHHYLLSEARNMWMENDGCEKCGCKVKL